MSERELERIFQEETDEEKVWKAVETFLNTNKEDKDEIGDSQNGVRWNTHSSTQAREFR